MTAYARFSNVDIRLREPVLEPDVVLVQDRTLLESVNVFSGLRPEGYVLINSSSTPEQLGLSELVARLPKGHVMTVSATAYAMEKIGRPLPGAAMLAAMAAQTNLMKLESVINAYNEKFSGRIAQANAEVAELAYKAILAQKELLDA